MKARLLRVRLVLLSALLILCGYAADRAAAQDFAARHRQEDAAWAQKSGLSPATVRKLRLIAGVTDDTAERIVNLDASSFRARRHILLVSAGGNGHCLDLHVIARRRNSYRVVWSASEMPTGAGFCRESPENPEAYAADGSRVEIKIPVYDYERNAPEATRLLTYRWNGKTYKLAEERTQQAMSETSRRRVDR